MHERFPSSFPLCLLSQPYKGLKDPGVNIISYPMSVILSHSIKSPLSAGQEVLQGSS